MLVDKIRDLYLKQKLSSREVAKKLGISQWAVLSKMRRNNIPRRSASEADHIVFSRKPLSYSIKKSRTQAEKDLRLAALMLYWAEGSKKGKHTVDFANSDRRMILVFLKALKKIYRVNKDRIRVFLYCYKNQKVSALLEYWSRLLNIPREQFTKPYIRKDFNINKSNKMPHGLVHIRYSDKKLLMQILSEIDKIQSNLNSPS